MHRSVLALVSTLVACVEADPPPDDRDPLVGGQTGQSGTDRTCAELFPEDAPERHASIDDVTSLGFSAREAFAALPPASATLTWSDGTRTPVDVELLLAPDATEVTVARSDLFDDCRWALGARSVARLRTGDGHLDVELPSEDGAAVWADGRARFEDGYEREALDLSAWSDAEMHLLTADLDGATTSGRLWFPGPEHEPVEVARW